MDKKTEAIKLLTAKELIDPLLYLLNFHEEITGLSPEEYYQIRYELAKKNRNHQQVEEALQYYKIYHRE